MSLECLELELNLSVGGEVGRSTGEHFPEAEEERGHWSLRRVGGATCQNLLGLANRSGHNAALTYRVGSLAIQATCEDRPLINLIIWDFQSGV